MSTRPSSPAAGIDIEHNGDNLGDGLFENCRVFMNTGTSLLQWHTYGTENIVFRKCIIQNGHSDPAVTRRAVWTQSKIIFDECKIYGNIVNVSESEFHKCLITDDAYQDYPVYVGNIVDVNSLALFDGCTLLFKQQQFIRFNLRGGARLVDTDILLQQPSPSARYQIGALSCTLENVNIVANFGSVANVSPVGESAFVSLGPELVLRGNNSLSGTGLAWGSRVGDTNIKLSRNEGIFFASEQVVTLSGDGPYDINIGNGNYIVCLSKETGTPAFRNLGAIIAQTSAVSSDSTLHGVAILSKRDGAVAGGVTITTAVVGNNDVIRLTPSTLSMNGETVVVRKIALSGDRLPV